MNAWLVDASNLPGQDNGAFNSSTIDPSAFFHASPNPQDPNQFQRMFNNGVQRNASPGFQNPNQVIPSKRPRPEDGMSMSPRPGPGGMTGSRSQTPQMPYPGYQGPTNGAQFAQHPTPYQHLQQSASPNVTQSPIMQDFDHQSARVGTASPSPFSPAGPQVGGQMSPSHSDHGSRVNTPQNTFIQGQGFHQGMGGQFQQGHGMTSAAPQASMQAQFGNMQQMPQGYHQAIAAQQARMQMQMQNQNRQMNATPQMGRPVAAGMNSGANPQQIAAIRQMQQNISKPNNPEVFMRGLQKFMMSRNLPLDPNPLVCGRPINLLQLYGTVMRMGGSKKVTAMNMWPAIAQQFQFAPMQFPTAAQEIRDCHQRNLGPYELAFLNSQQQKQMADQMQQGAIPRQPSDPSAMQQFQSPSVKQSQTFEQPQQLAGSPQHHTPVTHNNQATPVNGFATPTQARSQSKSAQGGHRLSASRQSQGSVPPPDIAGQFATPSPSQQGKNVGATPVQQPAQPEQKPEVFTKKPIEDPYEPMVLTEHRLHGPVLVDEMYRLGEDISRLRPTVPAFAELGVIDIHALNMGLKSGMLAEIRVALDALTTITCQDAVQISLANCDDLVESLVDCGLDQADFLAEHSQETSDVMLLPTYEELTRSCQSERTSLAEVPEFGSIGYQLDRAVDRMISITTVLRNLSFTESNHPFFGYPSVTEFLAKVARHIGTREMFLRTHQNTLDFMKDAVIFMSNVAHALPVSGREEALSLLNFVLAFSPSPEPSLQSDRVMFTAFNPSIHRYTPAAVDALAKLLAKDDPSEPYFGSIFSGDGSAPAQPELLTRAFGLAVSMIPQKNVPATTEARQVSLLHALLAADVLTTFVDAPLAQLWLGSVDGFATHLLRLSCMLCNERIPHINTMRQRQQAESDSITFGSLLNRGLSILRRLTQKSKQADNASSLPSGIVPRKEHVLGALLLPNVDRTIIRQFLTYAQLAE